MNANVESEDIEYPQTKFFQACRGVFEGGGCRGAGHVGAYEAAIKCGINFSEVAGTSAGAMIAALVGAGANPEFLHDKCAHLKFSDLLSRPKRRIGTFWLGRIASYFFRGEKRLFGKILHDGSAYSSEKLQEWVDDRLAELLPHAQRPIKFKDLILPTWVVATDLSGRRPKIWSKEGTPDESVALAVRCSCSIPLFFEPVELGNDFYVDGGMLSNLPSFVFADRKTNPLALGGRILAFQLAANESHKTEWNIGWLV
ncbi:MAG: patatin-like phospholipase family protein, partial [Candidatus Obscuribacterales bacterium]|nr:patatin-like phospholipase family protein [Steroidobacteraceae bacterium]